jgi:hypothetical protein
MNITKPLKNEIVKFVGKQMELKKKKTNHPE